MKKFVRAVVTMVATLGLVLPVSPVLAAPIPTINFLNTNLPPATLGQPYEASVQFSQSGNSILSEQFSGLPQGIGMPLWAEEGGQTPTVTSSDKRLALSAINTIALKGITRTAGTYNVTLFLDNTTGLVRSQQYTLTVNESGSSAPANADVAHTPGTNVVSNGTVYFITQDNARSPYTSAEAFLSYRFNSWAVIVNANGSDEKLPLTTTYYIPPRNGSLINDHGTVYLITNGQRVGFASAAAFAGLGYSFANVASGDTSFMVATTPINSSAMVHPDGTLINDRGTLYVMKDGSRMGFPSLSVLVSWGYSTTEAVPANSYDQQAPVSGVIQTRLAQQLNL